MKILVAAFIALLVAGSAWAQPSKETPKEFLYLRFDTEAQTPGQFDYILSDQPIDIRSIADLKLPWIPGDEERLKVLDPPETVKDEKTSYNEQAAFKVTKTRCCYPYAPAPPPPVYAYPPVFVPPAVVAPPPVYFGFRYNYVVPAVPAFPAVPYGYVPYAPYGVVAGPRFLYFSYRVY